MNNVKRIQALFILLFLISFFSSCHAPMETTTQYYTPCFKEDNRILFIKHQYLYKGHILPFASIGEYKTYLCEMDIKGENEELICQLPESDFNYSYFRDEYIHLSYGNNIIGICSRAHNFFIYEAYEIIHILDNVFVAQISFNGEKLLYEKYVGETYTLCISNSEGKNEVEYGFGSPEYWLPDNNRIVYNDKGNYILLDTTTSNTQSIPFNYHWSHDLQKIAYYDTDIDRLVIMDSDESNVVVTNWDGDISCWSYDGQYILSGFNLLDNSGNYIRTLREE